MCAQDVDSKLRFACASRHMPERVNLFVHKHICEVLGMLCALACERQITFLMICESIYVSVCVCALVCVHTNRFSLIDDRAWEALVEDLLVTHYDSTYR